MPICAKENQVQPKPYLVMIQKLIDSMHSFPVIHESRDLKQARPYGQYVDLLRLHARYSLTGFPIYFTAPQKNFIFPLCPFPSIAQFFSIVNKITKITTSYLRRFFPSVHCETSHPKTLPPHWMAPVLPRVPTNVPLQQGKSYC